LRSESKAIDEIRAAAVDVAIGRGGGPVLV